MNLDRLKIEYNDWIYYTKRNVWQFFCGLGGHDCMQFKNVNICIHCDKKIFKKEEEQVGEDRS